MAILRVLIVVSICLLVLAVSSAAAQEDTDALPYDPAALAERFLNSTFEPPLPDLPPVYDLDDTLTFYVGKTGSSTPVEIMAELLVRGPAIYIWKEIGIEVPSGDLRALAQQIQAYYLTLQSAANYKPPVRLPGFDAAPDTNEVLPIPDVDGDQRLFILYTTQLSEERDGIYNPLDSAPGALAQFSNGHELITVNTTPYPDMSLDNPLYVSAISRAIFKLVMTENNPTQALWLNDALNWRFLFASAGTAVSIEDVYAYFAAPETSLIRPAGLTNRPETLGGGQLFLNYIAQRYGAEVIRDLYLTPGGIDAIDSVLASYEHLDPTTSEPVAMRDLFADFVLANVIDLPFGDGRYVYPDVEFDRQRLARAQLIDSVPAEFADVPVLPFATRYFRYTARRGEVIEVTIDAAATVPRFSMPAERDPADRFYWSGSGAGRNAMMTRTLDLREVESAVLTFDIWHELSDGWNYGYVSISADGGETWMPLASDTTTDGSRYGTSYGAAFGGISNPQGMRPFPILGVTIGADGLSVDAVTPGGPADQAGIQPGDAIIGYDGREWQETPNVIALLANYAPGDTLNLYIQRRLGRLNMPVILGAHPTRVFVPTPLWQSQTVDLSAYAGGEILLRFETVTLPLMEDRGLAVDNIAIPEIGFFDGAESVDDQSSGWVMQGWSAVTNQVPARWIVQSLTSGTPTEPPRVRRLINDDSEEASGAWRFDLAAGETLYIAVSGVNGDTDQNALFDINLRSAPP